MADVVETPKMSRVAAFAGVARAPFLLLPPTLVASGAAAAAWNGSFSWLRSLLALIGLVSLHIAVDAFNEWSDMRSGIDLETERTPFSGGSGTLPAGGMSLRSAFWFAVVTSAIGLAIGVWFLTQVGLILLPILLAGAVAVLSYTDVLARIGIGELAAGFGLGAGPVIGSALVQDGSWSTAAAWVAVPAFLMTFNLLLLNEFPDEGPDRKGGRRNLVLIFGRKPAALIYAAAALATPLAIVLGVVLEALPPWVLLGVLPSVLLVKALQWAFGDTTQPVPVPAMGANVAWNLATNALVAVGFVVSFIRA
jgi:1,4-dihydroxy-2-naphthoate octaprenyltransferase